MPYVVRNAEDVHFQASVEKYLAIDFIEYPFQQCILVAFSVGRLLGKDDEAC